MKKREKNNIATRFTVNVILVDKDKECSLYLPQRQQQKRKDWSWSLGSGHPPECEMDRILSNREHFASHRLQNGTEMIKHWSRVTSPNGVASPYCRTKKEAKNERHIKELPWHIPARMPSLLDHFLLTGSAPLLRGVVGLQDHPLLIQLARCLCV